MPMAMKGEGAPPDRNDKSDQENAPAISAVFLVEFI
jgi:hypothetical protein